MASLSLFNCDSLAISFNTVVIFAVVVVDKEEEDDDAEAAGFWAFFACEAAVELVVLARQLLVLVGDELAELLDSEDVAECGDLADVVEDGVRFASAAVANKLFDSFK
jgi:hypothetical protein